MPITNGSIGGNGQSASSLIYKGTYDANTNTPTLVNGTGNVGDWYLTTVKGSNNPTGKMLELHEAILYNGSIWQSGGIISNTDSLIVADTYIAIEGQIVLVGDVLTIALGKLQGQINQNIAKFSNYYTKVESDKILTDALAPIITKLNNTYTKSETDAKIASAIGPITTNFNNFVTKYNQRVFNFTSPDNSMGFEANWDSINNCWVATGIAKGGGGGDGATSLVVTSSNNSITQIGASTYDPLLKKISIVLNNAFNITKGNGILIDKTNPINPIISIDDTIVATKTWVTSQNYLTNAIKSINGNVTGDIKFTGPGVVYTDSTKTFNFPGGGGSGTVTSVGISMPSIFSVANSPITTSGIINVTYNGTALPIANGGTGALTANAALNNLLPSQTSAIGKVLSTNGTNTSWIDLPTNNGNVTYIDARAMGGTNLIPTIVNWTDTLGAQFIAPGCFITDNVDTMIQFTVNVTSGQSINVELSSNIANTIASIINVTGINYTLYGINSNNQAILIDTLANQSLSIPGNSLQNYSLVKFTNKTINFNTKTLFININGVVGAGDSGNKKIAFVNQVTIRTT